MLFALVQMEIKHWSKLLHITFPMHFNCGVLFTLKRRYKRNCALLAFPVQCLIADIFGKQTGSVYREGLVDCVSEDAFNILMQHLKEVCDVNERAGGPQFHYYFGSIQSGKVSHEKRSQGGSWAWFSSGYLSHKP